MIFVFMVTIFFVPENVRAENSNDEIFGGQILSLTEKKPNSSLPMTQGLRTTMMVL